jgi:hypothetical protein
VTRARGVAAVPVVSGSELIGVLTGPARASGQVPHVRDLVADASPEAAQQFFGRQDCVRKLVKHFVKLAAHDAYGLDHGGPSVHAKSIRNSLP